MINKKIWFSWMLGVPVRYSVDTSKNGKGKFDLVKYLFEQIKNLQERIEKLEKKIADSEKEFYGK